MPLNRDPGRRHVGVADCSDLFDAVTGHDRIELTEDLVEHRHEFVRCCPFGDPCEADHVGKQDRSALEVPGLRFSVLFEVGSDLLGQDIEKKSL